ncbi:MAG: hypothetical protein IT356_10130 [Gemmatimonadaceae bacterium]|nr:hypothetical protein [Gemmatimonadaceae bacterium]
MARGSVIVACVATAFAAPVLVAQAVPPGQDTASVAIPESAWPPAGMCRVWLRGVPERQQPAPTDCGTALRTRPRDATLLMGQPAQEGKQLMNTLSPAGRAAHGVLVQDSSMMRHNPARGARGTLAPASSRVTVPPRPDSSKPKATRKPPGPLEP